MAALPNLLLPDWGNAGQQLGDALGARIERNKLAELVPGALAGDPAAMSQLTAYNPRLGMMAMDHQRQTAADTAAKTKERQAAVRQDLIDTSGLIVNMPEEQLPTAWTGIRAGLIGRNPELASRLPEQYTPEVLATARGLAGIKPKTPVDAQVPDQIEIIDRIKKDPEFARLYRDYLKPETFSGSTVVQLPGGGYGIMQGGNRGGSNTIGLPSAPLQFDAPTQAAIAGAEASARKQGEAEGDKAAKAPAAASYGLAAENMRQSIGGVDTGGALGIKGRISEVTDYQNSRLFNNRVQQLSTELRTVFRIPGEGTLSDQEQKQYGIQLPDIRNDPAVNEQIMKDLEGRIGARIGTVPMRPAGESQKPAAGGFKYLGKE